MKFRALILAAAFSLAGSVAAQAAGAPGIDFTASLFPGLGATHTFGYEFTVANASTDVVGLATWNNWNYLDPGDPAEVGLWDESGKLLASAQVSSTSPTMGSADWSYADITPVALTAGDTYYVGAYGSGADYFYSDPAAFTVNPDITLISGGFGGGFGPPTTQANYFAGNVILGAVPGAVPEPATWAMLILGLGMIGGAARRRHTDLVASA